MHDHRPGEHAALAGQGVEGCRQCGARTPAPLGAHGMGVGFAGESGDAHLGVPAREQIRNAHSAHDLVAKAPGAVERAKPQLRARVKGPNPGALVCGTDRIVIAPPQPAVLAGVFRRGFALVIRM